MNTIAERYAAAAEEFQKTAEEYIANNITSTDEQISLQLQIGLVIHSADQTEESLAHLQSMTAQVSAW